MWMSALPAQITAMTMQTALIQRGLSVVLVTVAIPAMGLLAQVFFE